MAVESTTLAPLTTFFPWGGRESALARGAGDSPLPAGEFIFNVRDGAVDQPGVGDSAQVNITCTLPVNHVYALTDLSSSVVVTASAGGNNWELVQHCILQNNILGAGSGQTMVYNLRFDGPGEFRNGGSAVVGWAVEKPVMPKFLVTGGSFLLVRLSNLTTNDVAAVVNFSARFLQYSLEQLFDVDVNSPTLIR